MTADEYKHHLLNYMSYWRAYTSQADQPETLQTRQAMAEAASHCMGISWVLADYHAEPQIWDLVPALAWEALGTRWDATMTKWASKLGSNQALAYTRPAAERKALKQWPTSAHETATSTPSDPALCAPPSIATDAGEITSTDSGLPASSATAESGDTSAEAPAAGAPATPRPKSRTRRKATLPSAPGDTA